VNRNIGLRFFSHQEHHMESTARGKASSNSGVSGSTEGILNKASSSAHAAVDSIARAADDVARKTQSAIDQAAAIADQALDKAAGAVAPTADWLAQQGERVNVTQKRLLAKTCNYVSANPLKALGMAAVAGYLLGRIDLR